MAYSVSWEPGGIYRAFSGFVSGDDIIESNLKLYDDIRFIRARYIINNFSEVSGHSIGAIDLQAFASIDEMIAVDKQTFKIALVVPQVEYFGLVKSLWELTKNDAFKYAQFRTVEDARKWVEIKG